MQAVLQCQTWQAAVCGCNGHCNRCLLGLLPLPPLHGMMQPVQQRTLVLLSPSYTLKRTILSSVSYVSLECRFPSHALSAAMLHLSEDMRCGAIMYKAWPPYIAERRSCSVRRNAAKRSGLRLVDMPCTILPSRMNRNQGTLVMLSCSNRL